MSFLRSFSVPKCAVAALLSLAGSALGQTPTTRVAVTTSHNNNQRTGLNGAESILNPSNVSAARFGKLFTRTVDGKIWCQPLYVPGVAITGKGTHNVVYVTTELGSAYAFDADDAAQSAPLWKTTVLPANATDGLPDQNVGSPVIDPATFTIYFTMKSHEAAGWVFRIYALDIRSGAQKTGSGTLLSATVPGTGTGSVNGQRTFDAQFQKQRPALLLLNGKLYAGFGGSVLEYDPNSVWNGWVFVIDAATLQREQVFCVAPNANGGGVWQAGNGLSADSSGNVYAIGANGNGLRPDGSEMFSFDADKGGYDFGNTILKLSLQAATGTRPGSLDFGGKRLTLMDWFTPYNWKDIELADQDLGSSGTMLIPGTTLIITGDKTGRFYVVATGSMGHFQAGSNSQIVNSFQAHRGHLHGGMVYYSSPKWGPLIYSWSEDDCLQAFRLSDIRTQGYSGVAFMRGDVAATPGMPGGFLSISANGTTDGTGIVWANLPYEGDANLGPVPGIFRAFDANDLKHELWNSKLVASRDDVGLFAKFSPPTVADGKVFLSSFSNRLNVYGLLPATAVPTAPTNLKAVAGLSKVSLSWTAVAGATSYSVKRATAVAGPYTTISNNVVGTAFDDTVVRNGTEYFYVVTASSSGGESGPSNQVRATPYSPSLGTVIGVNFNGSSDYFGPVTPMAANEAAGVVSAPNWNEAMGLSGTIANLKANGGGASGASGQWTSLGAVATDVPDIAGNNRMMKGYLANDDKTPVTLTVKNLPTSITSVGYDVYVYCDGVNPTATRETVFTLGGKTIKIVDAKNRNFENSFFPPSVADNTGNYVVFPNQTSASFTLSAVSGTSTDDTPRGPLNGVQIVAHQSAPVVVPAAPTSLAAKPGYEQVTLAWKAVTGATSYVVKRTTNPNAPYGKIATVSTLNYVDLAVRNGITYYYVVTAIQGTQESQPSNRVTATPLSGYAGQSISLNFGGTGTTMMGASEVAGQIKLSNWNNTYFNEGGQGSLLDNQGTVTGASTTWKAEGIGDTPIADTPGNNRMMRNYIFANAGTSVVNLFGLPTTLTQNGYDVYVYGDNYNGGARSGRYEIGTQKFNLTDVADTNFNGTFSLANTAVKGNYLRFSNITGATFTLKATATTTTDGIKGAPLSGVQIVGRNASPVSSTIPTTLSVTTLPLTSVAGTAQNINAVYGDADGATTIRYAFLRVGTSATDTAPFDVLYRGDLNKLYVYNGTTLVGGFVPGSNNIIQGPRGALDCSKTVVTRSGSVLTISWNLIPNSAHVGSKLVLAQVKDASNNLEAWRSFGKWTITAPAAVSVVTAPSAPTRSTSANEF